MTPERTRVAVTPSEHVTALLYPASPDKRAGMRLILAHGAGANQMSGFIVRYATALAGRGIDTMTFNFCYTEQRRRLPDRSDKLEACYRAVIAAAHDGAFGKAADGAKLAIGGKSMGGRIASQVAAADADGIAGLVLLGYPLHPPGRPGKPRTKHLPAIRVPMLIVQGSRDAFGTPDELKPIIGELAAPVDLCVVDDGDHSYKVPKRVASQEQVDRFVLDEVERWLRRRS